MKAITATFFAVVGLIGMGASAYAQATGDPLGARDPGVNVRQHRQHERIHQGVRSGELTRHEARGLRREQRAIRKEAREYKSDGKLTRDERRDLHRDLDRASRDIYREKHDAENR